MKTIQKLNHQERTVLKQYMLQELAEAENRSVSWGELADANELVSDEELEAYYIGCLFSPEDFI